MHRWRSGAGAGVRLHPGRAFRQARIHRGHDRYQSADGRHPASGAAGGHRAGQEMSMLGRRYDAETLERWNIINRVVDDEKLDAAAMAVALELANGPTLAHSITKQIAHLAAAHGVEAADEAMAQLQLPLWQSEDLRIGLESLQKNGPGLAVFKGR
ncbi:MAG: enoyl-CoA hydratase-related protein [Pseudomonadales bacterium]